MSVNKVFLLGRLGKDPTSRGKEGSTVAAFSLATDFVVGKDKEKKTEWHNVVAFGKTADVVMKYLKKGSQAHVEGHLQTRSFDDKNGGGKRYTTEVVVDRLELVGSKAAGSEAPSKGASSQPVEDEIPF